MKEPVCQGCRERDVRIAYLEQVVAELIERNQRLETQYRELEARHQLLQAQYRHLEERCRDLETRLGVNASNSSLPPSANPPGAPPPVVKKPTGRKPGGQPGHPPHLRQRLLPERLTKPIEHYYPSTCACCQHALPGVSGVDVAEPRWRQVVELPEILVDVTEHQAHGRECSHCGAVTWAEMPEHVRAHVFGPRLGAVMSYLSGFLHASKRGIEEFVEMAFGTPIALGSVSHLEQEMSAALAPAHAAAQQAVQEAASKNVDETGWKRAGKKCWLWGAATNLVACFIIRPTRGTVGMIALLGESIHGIVTSDRFSVYGSLSLDRRQVCWAHLKRDFQKLVDRGGAAQDIGEAGLDVVSHIFAWWHQFRGGGLTREQLQQQIAPVRQTLRSVLAAGCAVDDAKANAFCENLLDIEAALWTFSLHDGVDPTNNHIERLLRPGVLWRKNAFGCHSDDGCRFVERILTVVQTLRLQKRPVLDFLYQSLLTHRQTQSAPALLAGG
jgi:transposase